LHVLTKKKDMKYLKKTPSLLMAVMIILSSIFTGCKKDDDDNPSTPGNETGSFTDSRNGHVYDWVKIGGQIWMTENLAYKLRIVGYMAYDNDENNVAIYGYLYTWELAQNMAPDGWHLPSKTEWRTLVDYLGGKDAAYNKLLEKGTAHWGSPNDATNESGFTALPAGYYDQHYDELRSMGTLTMFHSTDESIVALTLNQNFKTASIEGKPLEIVLPIRCVKD